VILLIAVTVAATALVAALLFPSRRIGKYDSVRLGMTLRAAMYSLPISPNHDAAARGGLVFGAYKDRPRDG
jgi:hypothetical protein